MMMNCPKCGFLQDKDQYCAQCGVNMETWKPPRTPALKKLAGNWIFQLGLLFLIIFFVVMRDSFTTHAPQKTSLPPVENSIARNDQAAFQQTTEVTTQGVSFAPEEKKVEQKAVQQTTAPSDEKKPVVALKKQTRAHLFSISRAALFKTSSSARKIEEGVFVMTREAYNSFRKDNASDIRAMGRTKSAFQFGQPSDLFLTEEDVETGIRMGFFSQIAIEANSTPEGIFGEARFWNQLKLTDEPSLPIVTEFSMRKQDVLIIVDPTVHDYEFNEEERALFEASRRLQYLNNELFVEGLYDIVLIINVE